MKKKVFIEKTYAYPIEEEFAIYFKYGNSTIFSTGERTFAGDGKGIYEASELKIVSSAEIEEFYGITEANRQTKSEILVIQGIVTFFTGIPFVEYCGHSQTQSRTPIEVEDKDFGLKVGNQDFTSDLILLLQLLENEKSIIISLLDRWRKATYLVEESVDANLYHDEAILDYFHIIELLSEVSKDELKTLLESSIQIFLDRFYSDNLIYSPNQINDKINNMKGTLGELLVDKELSIAQKSKFFLEKYGLFDEMTGYFMDNLISTRNAIAHGRNIYRNNVLWPVPPFFYLAQDSYQSLPSLKVLTARMISCFAGLKCWETEWEQEKFNLLPVKEIFSAFLKDPTKYSEITIESLYEGNSYNISWMAAFWYYTQDTKRFSIERICTAMKAFYTNTSVNENNATFLFNISVVLCDSLDKEISDKAIENVKLIIENQWYPWSNYKDIYGYLDYHNLPPIWYKSYLLNRTRS
jgi:hypothetical protein